ARAAFGDATAFWRAVVRRPRGGRPGAAARRPHRAAARARPRRGRAGGSGRTAGGGRGDRELPPAGRLADHRASGRGRRGRAPLTMTPPRYEVIGSEGIGGVQPGADVARIVVEAAARQRTPLAAGD